MLYFPKILAYSCNIGNSNRVGSHITVPFRSVVDMGRNFPVQLQIIHLVVLVPHYDQGDLLVQEHLLLRVAHDFLINLEVLRGLDHRFHPMLLLDHFALGVLEGPNCSIKYTTSDVLGMRLKNTDEIQCYTQIKGSINFVLKTHSSKVLS